MRRWDVRAVVAVCVMSALGAGAFGMFAATGSAGSQNATFDVFVAPTPVTKDERGLITAKMTNGPTGTINHVVIAILIDKPLGELTTGDQPLGLSSGCTRTSADTASQTTISCSVGQMPAGVREIRYVSFTAGSQSGSTISVNASVTFDEAGAGGGKKNVAPGSFGPKTVSTTVVGPSPDVKGGCAGASGTIATSGGGSSNIDTAVAPSGTGALCTPVFIEETALPSGAKCALNDCTTAGSFVTFPGVGVVTITFSFPPPGSMPQTLTIYQFANPTDPNQVGVQVPPCGNPTPELACVQSTTRSANLRQIVVQLRVFGGGVDPGFAG
jgi:hypothetical protein